MDKLADVADKMEKQTQAMVRLMEVYEILLSKFGDDLSDLGLSLKELAMVGTKFYESAEPIFKSITPFLELLTDALEEMKKAEEGEKLPPKIDISDLE